jgi:ferredoxin-NADP reductase
VTIKRVPNGVVSNHFHDRLNVGDIVDVKAPGGHFFLDLQEQTPVVLIGGGVGVTPVLSMFGALAESGKRREAWFFYGVRHSGEHVMKDHLRELVARHPSLHLHVCYSDPTESDKASPQPMFQHAERVSVDLFKRVLPSNQMDFYLCGPPPMMSGLTKDLKAWGVPEDRIHFEAFGAATVKKPELQHGGTTTVGLKVEFARANKAAAWNPDAGCLLDFAKQNGVQIESGCRAGNCGTCLVAIKSGEVNYLKEPGVTVEAGSCLTCIAVPKTAVVLDA